VASLILTVLMSVIDLLHYRDVLSVCVCVSLHAHARVDVYIHGDMYMNVIPPSLV
jgi:hypothetical protein